MKTKFKRISRKEQKCRDPRIHKFEKLREPNLDLIRSLYIEEMPIIDWPLSYGVEPVIVTQNTKGLIRYAYANIRKFKHYAKINPNYYRKIDNNRRKK